MYDTLIATQFTFDGKLSSWVSRHRRWAIAILVAVIVTVGVVIGVVVWLTTRQKKPHDDSTDPPPPPTRVPVDARYVRLVFAEDGVRAITVLGVFSGASMTFRTFSATDVDLGAVEPIQRIYVMHQQLFPAERRVDVALELLAADNRTVVYRQPLSWKDSITRFDETQATWSVNPRRPVSQ